MGKGPSVLDAGGGVDVVVVVVVVVVGAGVVGRLVVVGSCLGENQM